MPTNDHRNVRINETDFNYTFDGNYFYTFNNDTNSIIQKTDDGTIAFTYPCNVSITEEIKTIQYDGIDQSTGLNGMAFWTLEDKSTNDGIIIRRLVVDNYVAKQNGVNTALVDVETKQITLTDGPSITWNVNQMAVEVYETKLMDLDITYPLHTAGATASANNATNTYLRIYDDVSDNVRGVNLFNSGEYSQSPALRTVAEPNMNKSQKELLQSFTYDNGDEIVDTTCRIVIGPDAQGRFETVLVQGNIGDADSGHYDVLDQPGGNALRFLDIQLTTGLTNSYPEGTPVRIYKHIYLFNNHGGGKLHIINDVGNIVKTVSSSEYANVSGATFSQRERRIIFSKQTNASFIEPNKDDLVLVKTMLLNNIEVDDITVIPIYDLCTSFSGALFRMQDKQVFNGSLETFTENNYVVTALFPLVTSISIRPVPQIIAADNADLSYITVTVRDQFNNPVVGVFVDMTEDDATGGSGGVGGVFQYDDPGPPPNTVEYNGSIEGVLQTDSNGQVVIKYRAGDNNTDVTIAASVQQLN